MAEAQDPWLGWWGRGEYVPRPSPEAIVGTVACLLPYLYFRGAAGGKFMSLSGLGTNPTLKRKKKEKKK